MEKICSRCKKSKKLSEFNNKKSNPDGLSYVCRGCTLIFTRSENQKATIRDRMLMKKYGITQEEYLEILEDQVGVCKICGISPEQQGKVLSVDHCHDTGIIRGLLCDHCNMAIGKLGDNARGVRRALQYLIDSGDNSLYRDEYPIESPENREDYSRYEQLLQGY